jgi:hypothetical protein
LLQPLNALPGTTDFTTSGGVIKHEEDLRRAILQGFRVALTKSHQIR